MNNLINSQERLRLALENSDIAIWDWNIANNVIYLSDAWSVMLGGPRHDTFSSSNALSQLIHEDDVVEVRQAIAAMVKGDSPAYLVEHRVRSKDGAWKWIVSRGKVVERSPHGRAMRAVGTSMDITLRKHIEESSPCTQGFVDSIVEHIPDIVFVKDAKDLRFVWINRAAEDLIGISRDECVGKTYHDFFPAAQAASFDAGDREVLYSKQVLDVPEEIISLRNGHERILHTQKIPILDAQDRPEFLLCISQDITERKLAEQALRTSEERFQLIAENVSDLIAIVDIDGKRLYNSPSYRTLFGEDVLLPGSDSFAQIHLDDREKVIQLFHETVKSGQGRPTQFRFLLPDGNVRFIESHGSAVRGAGGEVERIIVVSRDVTERLRADERLRHLAHHDLLTNLPNRVLMRDRIEQALIQAQRSNKRAALLFIDLDHFKNINDLLGHTVGDQLLREVAQRLKRCVRDSDTVSRQGGDEFIVLLQGLPMRAHAVVTAEKIVEAFSQPFSVSNHTLDITASIGLSVYPDDGTDAETLLRNADTAMYHTKASGRHGYQFFNAELAEAVRHRADLGKQMREAIGSNEFRLHYQPRIDLTTGGIPSIEALVRWNHPELGLIGPMQFIPYAEESGLIVSLGKWILKEACRQNAAWRRSGFPHLRIAVNVSGRQLRQNDFVNMVSKVLSETRMPASALELELTETVFMQEAGHTAATFGQLRKMGVQLAIDDFGTGYSNLSYLKRFGVDRLKIDQSFIRDITTDRNDAAIVSAIMAMARSLQIAVTAEGVETEQQLLYLRAEGCSEAQGFLFSRPLAADEFEQQMNLAWSSALWRQPPV
ncbi:MAG: EAL domain-containing protein [Burkholderiales bacterium]